MLRSKTFRLFVKFSCPDTSITDNMATDSAEMEDAVGSEVWTLDYYMIGVCLVKHDDELWALNK